MSNPTKGGWYWLHATDGHKEVALVVRSVDLDLARPIPLELHYQLMGRNRWLPITQMPADTRNWYWGREVVCIDAEPGVVYNSDHRITVSNCGSVLMLNCPQSECPAGGVYNGTLVLRRRPEG